MPFADPDVRRQYQREWFARRRKEWFDANGPCVRCKSWTDLRLDHIDPAQKVSHKIWSWSKDHREAELAKCQVLCEPCHIAKTIEGNEMAHGVNHGSAKLTESDVREILVLRESGQSFRSLGQQFGVWEGRIRDICNGTTWSTVTGISKKKPRRLSSVR